MAYINTSPTETTYTCKISEISQLVQIFYWQCCMQLRPDGAAIPSELCLGITPYYLFGIWFTLQVLSKLMAHSRQIQMCCILRFQLMLQEWLSTQLETTRN